MKKIAYLCLIILTMSSTLTTGQQPDRALDIPGQYIVVFKDTVVDVPEQAYQLMRIHRGTPLFIYQHALKGFAAHLPEQAVEALSRNPNIAYIEPDSVVWAFTTQNDATWGLDRIDQRNLPLNNTYNYNQMGSGVHVYILDTGIRISHVEFGSRASYGFDFIESDYVADDCHGHGTHVAGTVGGTTYGVAKSAWLVAVRVLDCSGSGTTSGVIAGIDWVTENAQTPAVANMSLGGRASTSLDQAVQKSIALGISYVVSAGNGNIVGRADDACKYSPARIPEAMTISATNSSDEKASWANFGDCVDWFAPGVNITSAWYTSDTETNTISGTSMASPHTAGVAALYLEANPEASPQQVRDALYDATTKGVVTSSKTANNHLLYSLVEGGTPPDNTPPTAAFTYITDGLMVQFTDTSTDADGNVVAWSWNFGDNSTSAEQSPSHTYSASGTYNVSLTVTDDDEATNTTSQNVTVSSTQPGDITLTATGYRVKGVHHVDLVWREATTSDVFIYRDGVLIDTTANDGAYTDNIGKKGGGTYTYYISDGSSSSNEVTIVF